MAYGQEVLRAACAGKADEELLSEAASLLAWKDPATSPTAHLLTDQHKAVMAADLNRAILSHQVGWH